MARWESKDNVSQEEENIICWRGGDIIFSDQITIWTPAEYKNAM
jgi:hypothetical protein